MSTHRSVLYRETGQRNDAGANILTRGNDVRDPDESLSSTNGLTELDVHCGQLFVSDMPDLTKHNEAYLEISVIAPRKTQQQTINIPYQFKLQVEVDDGSFSTNVAGAEILRRIQLEGHGLEFHCRLTELDKIEQKKFHKMQGFLEKNDIASIVTSLLTVDLGNIPINQLFGFIRDTSEIIDELNDDDRLWLERPKLDLRHGTSHPLYEGWYAFVDEPDHRRNEAPYHLFEMNGELYTDYKSDTQHTHLDDRTYLTWQMIRA